MKAALRARSYRPLLLVDLAVPRNIDAAVDELEDAYLFNVDDLELHLRSDEKRIAVRSASRVGYSDMGANRARVEELRALIDERGGLQ